MELNRDTDPADVDTVARTIWGEARGVGTDGMEAVACVIRNRADKGGWWGATMAGVCKAPYQFSCWLPGSADYNAMIATGSENESFRDAMSIAIDAVTGRLQDTTDGADSYYDTSIDPPSWAEPPARFIKAIGTLRFYKVE